MVGDGYSTALHCPSVDASDREPDANPLHCVDTARRDAIIAHARELHQCEGEVEIDDNAVLSEGDDNGCYVAAWIWIDFNGTPFDKTNGEPEPSPEEMIAELRDAMEKMR